VTHSAPAPRSSPPALVGRLFSLSGVVPLGAFLFLHLALNARSLSGDAAFARAVQALHAWPALVLALVEWVFIFVPLLGHSAIGLWMVVTRAPLRNPAPSSRALRVAMRATGVGAAAFVVMHLIEVRFHSVGARLDGPALLTVLVADLSSTWHGVPWRGAAYLVGTGCIAFHFAAGLWSWFGTTRPGQGGQARKWAGWAAGAIGAGLWVLAANIVVFQATGVRLFGGPADEAGGSGEACPSRSP
jgi:succinate dehydrogenase / fumarate reductase, cytochrome b subunit